MTREQEFETWQKWKQTGRGEHLTDLIKSMDPLLQKQVNKFSAAPLPRPFLESKAKVLAAKALRTYDPTKGAALGTHVTNELRHLSREVAEYQNVGRIPEARVLTISKFNNIKSHLEQDLGREPNTYELADALSWNVREVERMQLEMRKDLTADEEIDPMFGTHFIESDRPLDAAHFVYHSLSNNEERKLLEHMFGLWGAPRITSTAELARRLGKSQTAIRNMKKRLASEINRVSRKM